MSKLSELIKSQISAANPANSANPSDLHENFSNYSSGDIENSKLKGGAAVSLSPVQEAARADVLSQLARNPAVQRAFVNRFEADGTMIVTLAIRGVGTGELAAIQANVTSGPQQVVNNGESGPSKLLEQTHGERLDRQTTSGTAHGDFPLATVGEIDRTENDGR